MSPEPQDILVDLCHPAHVHFFRHPIAIWQEGGHRVQIAAREKDVALPLLREFGLSCTTIGNPRSGIVGRATELVSRDIGLFRHARNVRASVITAIGGTFAAHAAFLARIPSVVFYDTEIAKLQNAITYPLSTTVVVPRCYSGPVPSGKEIRYPGYHELSYLHPSRFRPDRNIALRAGLSSERPTFLLRFVAWTANHDFGDSGISPILARRVIERLSAQGKVIISSETPLDSPLASLRYEGRPSDMHHLMGFCAGYFGESATMASECAVLGVPAVYAAHSPRGYTDEQDTRYGLVHNIRDISEASVAEGCDWLLANSPDKLQSARSRMLSEVIDVAGFAADTVLQSARAGR